MEPEGWSVTTVGEALERVSLPVDVDIKERYQQIGIRSHGKGLFDKEHVTGEELGDKRVFWVEPNCFIVNIVFAWEQAVGKTTGVDVGKIASHRFPMYRPRRNRCDVDFIDYLFKTPRGKYLLGLASPGGAGRNKTLGQKEFDRVPLTLPPLPEQRKIADILLTWDRAIEVTEALLATARAQKRALMQALLTGKRRFPEFEGQEWREVRLGDVANIAMGSSPKSEAYNTDGIGLPLIQGNADIRNGRSSPRSFTSEITTTCRPGDILFSVRAPVGTVAVSDHEACIGRGAAVITPKKNTDWNWLHQTMIDLESKWRRVSQGSTFEAVNSKDIKTFLVPAASSRDEQSRIGKILQTSGAEIDAYRNLINKLRTEKKALMQQLLTGKRRVVV